PWDISKLPSVLLRPLRRAPPRPMKCSPTWSGSTISRSALNSSRVVSARRAPASHTGTSSPLASTTRDASTQPSSSWPHGTPCRQPSCPHRYTPPGGLLSP
ncbi:hypothetical protein B484DRAFT_443789, partial [Ochromonadaceae sp. CCMP2298]